MATRLNLEKKTKVLIIGLDGASFDLIRPWAEQGKLPNLARLFKEGTWGNLRSVPNMNSAPAWSSFATGKNPGKHGIFYFDERIPGTYQKRYLNAAFRKGESFWSALSSSGYRVGVINVPITYPAEKVNGFMLAGLDTPGLDSPGFCYPPNLIQELQPELGEYIVEPGIPGYIKAGRKDLALERLLQEVDVRLAYTHYLMEKEPWDLLVTVFTASDNAQHFFWKDMDANHPEHDPNSSYGEAIRRVYQRLDEAVGELLSIVPEGTTVVVISDHGGGFNPRGPEYLKEWLASLGLLTYLHAGPLRKRLLSGGKRVLTLPLIFAYRQADKILPREAKLRLTRIFPGIRERMEIAITFGSIDWSRTKAYAHGARHDIWINLAGREPQGIVQPGKEYEELRDFIIAKLWETRDLVTGKPVVQGVHKREEIYQGECLEKAPDVTIRWQTEFVSRGFWIPQKEKDPPPVPPLKPNPISGDHRLHGILMMRGPGVRSGNEIQGAQILDLAPTMLWLFGLPVPEDMDGRVLDAAFEEEFLLSHPLLFGGSGAKEALPREYTEEEAQTIEKRLRGLGYVP